MRFYIINSKIDDSIFDAQISLAKAKAQGRRELGPGQFTIDMVECAVNSETIRLLLSGQGGYANNFTRVFGED